MRAQFGMGRPGWFSPIPFLSKLYVDDGMHADVGHKILQQANAIMWASIPVGVLWPKSLNLSELAEEGQWGNIHAMLGFEIDSKSLRIALPEGKIAGARVLADQFEAKHGSRAVEVVPIRQILGHIEHCRASNVMWKFLTAPLIFCSGTPMRRPHVRTSPSRKCGIRSGTACR